MPRRSTLHHLEPTQIHKLTRSKGSIVKVHDGLVWLTEQGDQQDHILCQTQSYRISGHGMVLIGATNMSRVKFEILRPDAWPHTLNMKDSR